ncbi:MAG: hypothetical protein HQK50_06545 [Oligoflexia bacterium]|nr:hypothetical protein [Oligoflexia bacterium]
MHSPIPETSNINLYREKSLHRDLKTWYLGPSDRVEVNILGKVVDIFRDNSMIIEIQTRNLSSLKHKIELFLGKTNYQIRIVFPMPVHTTVITLDKHLQEIRKRKSPKHFNPLNLFSEIIGIPHFLKNPRVSLELLLIKQTDLRCADGKGSWYRKGNSLLDKKLLSVEKQLLFNHPSDFMSILPAPLPLLFTNKLLAHTFRCNYSTAAKISYCLKKMDLIRVQQKLGNSFQYISSYFQ